MAFQTLATADAVLKEYYLGPIIEQLNYKTYMLDQIERDNDHVDFTGRRAIVPIHSANNRRRGSIGDGGTLPVPGFQGYQDAIVPIRYHAQGISITDMAIKQATGNEGSFVNLLDQETKFLGQDMKKDINRQVFGDGTGLLASLSAGGPATTVTVDTTLYLKVGDVVDILNRTTGAANAGTGRTITAINRTTKVVTLDASVTVAATEGLYVLGNSFASGGVLVSNEMDGLRNISAQNRTLHDINSATAGNEFWNGQQRDAASSVAGESLFEQLADDIAATGQSDGPDVFLTTRGIKRRLADTYQSQKRYTNAENVSIHGGYTAIMVNETPVVADDDVPKGFVFAISKDAFKWFELDGGPDWLKSEDGSIWQMAASTTGSLRRAAWEAWFVWYAALGSLAPNRVGRIINATDDSV